MHPSLTDRRRPSPPPSRADYTTFVSRGCTAGPSTQVGAVEPSADRPPSRTGQEWRLRLLVSAYADTRRVSAPGDSRHESPSPGFSRGRPIAPARLKRLRGASHPRPTYGEQPPLQEEACSQRLGEGGQRVGKPTREQWLRGARPRGGSSTRFDRHLAPAIAYRDADDASSASVCNASPLRGMQACPAPNA